MLTATDRKVAQNFRHRIASIVPVLDMCVFGSRARGDATPESDLDLFVEVEYLTPQLREQIFELAWEVGFEEDRVISTIVTTPEQLEHGAIGANPLIHQIEHEGIHV